VRKALQEREVLLRSAPHIIWPLRFVMPHDANQRPAWMIRAGLFMYDYLAKREILPASEGANLAATRRAAVEGRLSRASSIPMAGSTTRLVVLNAMDAQERGARILTRTKCISARREGDAWHAVLEHQHASGVQQEEVRARAIVNAAGPGPRALRRRCRRPGPAAACA
jgi:glycerol-3-phosphate dehydrogenase